MRYSKADTKELNEKVRGAIQQSIKSEKGLFIFGNTGTGKTYTLNALAKATDKAKVENFVELLVEFRDYMQKGLYFEKLNELTNRSHLFIDDIGSEKTSEFVLEFLYLIVNKRYENMKRTVIATNLNLADFTQRYGDRVVSRIVEMCELVEITGEDRRI